MRPTGSRDYFEENRNTSIVVLDKDAMLEFHFDEQGLDRGEDPTLTNNKSQRVPETSSAGYLKRLGVNRVPVELSAVPLLTEQSSMPVVSASNAAHSVWSSATTNKP